MVTLGGANVAPRGEEAVAERYLIDRLMALPDGTLPHLGVRNDGSVASVALLSGSPARVELMAGMLTGAMRVGDRRGYLVYTGSFDGSRVTVATSGVGAPSASIAIEELGAVGARTFVRVGSCAAISRLVPVGGLAVATGAVVDEGTSRYYAPANFPAVTSLRVTQALIAAAVALGQKPAVGLTRSTDSFYEGERKREIIDLWKNLGVLTFEMETSTFCTVCAARGWEAGAILVAGSNLLTGEATYQGDAVDAFESGQSAMLRIALSAAAKLSEN